MFKANGPPPTQLSYDDEPPTFYDHLPAYEDVTSYQDPTLGTTLTLDPTGQSIITLPLSSSSPPLYTLSTSLLQVTSFSAVKILAPDSTPLYSISEQFITPIHTPVPSIYKNVTAFRSTGLAARIGLRKVVWDFFTQIPIPVDKDGKAVKDGEPAAGGAWLHVDGMDLGKEKLILRFKEGKWLDPEMMHFLVSAWCVVFWKEVGKRVKQFKQKGV
ncbi:uncharacterized protein LY89DRAFT_147303 [Mollisia scopiformis]|uniref:Uncharacterized protein n=1 Tax=Mollisia scopiformis TaxID=149040 RepID=A0A194X0R8_MOLSC|nr:uncharacterized protein LY89DRAFT_147303 [Mollisia scopiformis]KUJ13793.1 hypothetical protein LY89DRAFT_147303 [Mollisia scopiformis]